MRTLHEIRDILLKKGLRPRADEASCRFVGHPAHADSDFHAAGYVAGIHEGAERAGEGALHRALGRAAAAWTSQAQVQRRVAGVPAVVAADKRPAVVVVMLAGLHRRL